jgi:hypothetical protein
MTAPTVRLLYRCRPNSKCVASEEMIIVKIDWVNLSDALQGDHTSAILAISRSHGQTYKEVAMW